jgi:repressor LexA
MSLTPAMRNLLLYLQRYIDRTGGVAPSFDEMRDAMQLASKSGVSRLLDSLEERKYIKRLPHRARCVSILKRVPDHDGPAHAYRRALQDIAAGEADPEAHAREVLERFS